MKTIDEIHRDNLATIAKDLGGAGTAAELIGCSPSQFSQWLNGSENSGTGKPRGMRPSSCRQVETKCGKQMGWMDVDHSAVKIDVETHEISMLQNLIALYAKSNARGRKLILIAAEEAESKTRATSDAAPTHEKSSSLALARSKKLT